MIEFPTEMAIDGSQDVVRAFTKLNFVVGLVPVAKLSNDTSVFHQISCLPKFNFRQQVMLAQTALTNLGFRAASIISDTNCTDPNKRRYVTANHAGITVTYHIDLGLLEIVLG